LRRHAQSLRVSIDRDRAGAAFGVDGNDPATNSTHRQ
jgi:hypothetical protein